jgi:tetratricopeptide (TPR) repeat protein
MSEEAPQAPSAAPAASGAAERTVDYAPSPDLTTATAPRSLGRYQIVEELGRGGMGVVYRCRDADLDRWLALKVLREEHSQDDHWQQRFREEARIMGRLQHPGVAPIHEVGRLDDGRPFFAMKQVRGQTLAQMLGKPGPSDSGPTVDPETSSPEIANAPADHSPLTPHHAPADLPRLLGIFEQVCQTMAFAHSQGVLHRDLKPGNVMVGAFAEVQVMDWGLAKQLGGEAVSGEWSRDTTHHSPPEHTQAGTVLGTPAYMAPEQARGEVDTLDKRCDVFSLGAILCRILTGQPAYTGKNASDIHRKALHADLAEAWQRLDRCGADAALIDLARRCLQPNRADRPSDAGAVAQAVTAYQESVQQRLQQAEVDRAAAQARAAEAHKRRQVERQRQRLVLILIAAGIVLVAGLVAAGWWYQQDRLQLEAEDAGRRKSLNEQVAAALNDGDKQRADLYKRLADISEVYKLVGDPDQWAALLQNVRAAWKRAHSLADSYPALLDEQNALRLAAADQQMQFDKDGLGLTRELDELHLAAAASKNERELDMSVNKSEYEKTLAKLNLNLQHGTPAELAAQVRQSPYRYVLVTALDHWATQSGRDPAWQARLCEVARLADPDPAWRDRLRDPKIWNNKQALLQLAARVDVRSQSPTLLRLLARRLFQFGGDGVPMLRQAVHIYPRDFWLHMALAAATDGDPVESVGHYCAALALRPSCAPVHGNLGTVFYRQKNLAEAKAHLGEAVKLDPNYMVAWYGYGIVLGDQGDREGAARCWRKAIATNANYAPPYLALGNLELNRNHLEESIKLLSKAVQIQPNPKAAVAHNKLGLALHKKKNLDAAIQHYEAALALDPNYVECHHNLASALNLQEKWKAAIPHWKKVIVLQPRNANAFVWLAQTLERTKDYQGAIRNCETALAIDPKSIKARHRLGAVFYATKDLDMAIQQFQLGLKIEPTHAQLHFSLGVALHAKKDLPAALSHFQQGLQKDPGNALAHNYVGAILADLGDAAAAVPHFKKALALQPRLTSAVNNLGAALFALGDAEGAIAQYKLTLQIHPKFPLAFRNLGMVLKEVGRFTEAKQATAEALKLLSPGHSLRPDVQKQLQQCDELLGLDQKLAAVRQGQDPPPSAAEQLVLAEFCQKYKQHYAAAAKFYAGADSLLLLKKGTRHNAAIAAALAAAGQGRDAAALAAPDKARLRAQALTWLHHDLELWQRQAQTRQPGGLRDLLQYLSGWHVDPALGGVRDPIALAKLPPDEKKAWHKLWADVAALTRETATCFKVVTEWKGIVTPVQPAALHEVKLQTGTVYVFDLESKRFGAHLKLQDAQGKTLAEDDNSGGNGNSRLVFTPTQSGTYRLVATSLVPQSMGYFTLTVRTFRAAK